MQTIEMGALTLRFLHSKHDTNGSIDMFEMELQPGGRMPVPHCHTSWDEAAYGLAGTTTWTIDGKTIEVGPGQSVFIPRGIVHAFNNTGTVPAKCLSVLTPAALGPPTSRKWHSTWPPNPQTQPR